MSRLDKERQLQLEPKRMAYAKKAIENKGYTVIQVSDTQLQFEHTLCHKVNFFLTAVGLVVVQSKTVGG